VTEGRKSQLTKNTKGLVELMQRLNFGHVYDLPLRGGEPILEPPPRVDKEVKFASDNGSRPELAREDFILKVQVREMLSCFDSIGDGVIHCIEVKNGLPFKMIIQEDIA